MSVKKNSLEKENTPESHHEFKKKKLPALEKSEVVSSQLESGKESVAEKRQHHKDPKEDKMSGKEKSKIDRELQEIYENSDGTLPDMHTFEKRKSHRLATAFFFLLSACVFLGSVAWAGFFWFQPEVRFQEDKVILSISGEDSVEIGDTVTYRIRYRNDQRIPLAKATLQVRYPEGFVFASSSVLADTNKNDEWALGALEEGGSGYIDVVGALYGDMDREQSFRAFLNYTPANISSEFQKVATTNVKLDRSPVVVTIDAPKDMVAGSETTLQITVQMPKEPLNVPLVLEVNPGNGFIKKLSDPEGDKFAQYRFTIPAKKEMFIVKLIGTFAAGSDAPELSARVLGKKQGSEDTRYVFASATYSGELVERNVRARIVLNGTATGTIAVAPGEMLHTSVVVENTGDTAIKNVRLRAIFDAPSQKNKSIFNWADIRDEYEGNIVGEQLEPTLRRGSVQWDSSMVAALREVGPGKSVTIEFSLPIKDVDDVVVATLATTPVQIAAATEVQYDDANGKEVLSGNILVLLLSSNTALAVEDKPSADASGHQITWLLSNEYHELANIHLEADVYGDTRWEEAKLVVPAGKAVFDADKKRLSWDIERMPTSIDVFGLQFGLTIEKDNPTQKFLVSKVRGHATDIVTGKEITIVGDEVGLHP